jgi:hypothetical protein
MVYSEEGKVDFVPQERKILMFLLVPNEDSINRQKSDGHDNVKKIR